jgi:2-iminobutanoate/2-iminopropanoate deaminase
MGINTQPTYWHSAAVTADGWIFSSYQAGAYDDNGAFIGTLEGQTEQCIRNLSRTLAEAGATLADVVKVTLLVKSVADFKPVIAVYGRYFADICPARTTIVTEFLGQDILVQLDAVAYRKPQ